MYVLCVLCVCACVCCVCECCVCACVSVEEKKPLPPSSHPISFLVLFSIYCCDVTHTFYCKLNHVTHPIHFLWEDSFLCICMGT